MAEDSKCQQCDELKEASKDAYRSFLRYRPMHSGHRPQSRWYKADREARGELERAYHLAEAEYNAHRASHSEAVDPREFVKNLNIIIRKGRLKP